METFILCPECAVGVAYGEWSHLDYSDASEKDRARIASAVESMGLVTMAGPYSPAGSFRCYVCDTDALSGTAFNGTG